MQNKYIIRTIPQFDKALSKLTAKDSQLLDRCLLSIENLAKDPFSPNLKTHKVQSRIHGLKYSSRVSGDIRIIWDFEEEKIVILLLAIGGHDGRHRVYK